MNKKLIRLTESDLHRIIKESVNRILKESIEGDFESCADKSSKEYQEGFQEGIKDARSAEDRNKLLDKVDFVLRRYKKAFNNGYPIGEDPREQWHLGWADGVRQDFKEADAYEELQNQDYEPGWQFNS